MSGITDLFTSVGGSIAGEFGKQIGYGLGELTGYNDRIRQDQINQQQKLTDMQSKANLGLMKESYKEQKALWDATSAPEQVKKLQEAGLNSALMYAKGGTGGSTGSGGASVGGGQASDESSRMRANTESVMTGMALQKLQSEIAVNNSIAEKNRADAQTTTESRSWLVEKLKQEGKGEWLENIRNKYMMETDNTTGEVTAVKYVNDKYGEVNTGTGTLFDQQISNEIAQIYANANNQNAQALLTNEKAKGYWQELLNDTARADNDKIKATALKLSSEWSTGEFTNWKTWADLARGIVHEVIPLFK